MRLRQLFSMIRFVIGVIRRSGPLLVIGLFVLMLFEAMIPAVQLYASKELLDGISGSTNLSDPFFYFWGSAFAATFLLQVISVSLTRWLRVILGERVMLSTNLLLLESIHKTPGMMLFEETSQRDRLETLRDTTTWLPLQMVEFTFSFFTSFLSLIGILVVVSSVSPVLTCLLLLSLIPYIVLSNRFSRLEWDYTHEQAEARRRLSYDREMLLHRKTAKEMKLFSLEDYFRKHYRDTFSKMFRGYQRLQYKTLQGTWGSALFYGIVAGLGYFWLTLEIGKGQMTLGSISLYLGALFQLSSHLKNTANDGIEMVEVWRMGRDFAAFLTLKSDLTLANQPLPQAEEPLSIRFEDVSFRYPQRDEWVLKDVSFTIRPGECVAFVGENGAGKSTIVKLICRFYDVTKGRILINGVDIRQIDIDQLRNAISVVFQQFGQYGLTLAENVALGDLRKKDQMEEIKKVIQKVEMEEEVARLRKGYQQMMGREWNGTDLSGGQWQRIALARAFLKNASLLILDEPTASLDVEAEYQLYRQFHQLIKDRTTILISHRFSTVRMADRILVLKGGRFVEDGTHQELLERKGEYAKMLALQQKRYKASESVV